MGALPNNTIAEDYQLVCFINQFDLSFDEKDHHVRLITLTSQIGQREERNGHLIANLRLTATLADKGRTIGIPHNSVSGFLLAVNQYPQYERLLTLRQFIDAYNQISHDLYRNN